MAVKRNTQTKLVNIPKGIGIGLVVSIATTIIGAAIFSWLMATERIGEGSEGYLCVILLLVSGLLGSLVSNRMIQQKRLPMRLLSGSVYFLSLLAANVLFFEGKYQAVGQSALVILAGALSVAILGMKNTKNTKRKRRK